MQLISGDGHILHRPCPAPETVGLTIVRSTDRIGSAGNGKLCFEVTGVRRTADTTVDVNPNADTQVGIATTPPGDATALLRLDASR